MTKARNRTTKGQTAAGVLQAKTIRKRKKSPPKQLPDAPSPSPSCKVSRSSEEGDNQKHDKYDLEDCRQPDPCGYGTMDSGRPPGFDWVLFVVVVSVLAWGGAIVWVLILLIK